jgi:hypothetical protein
MSKLSYLCGWTIDLKKIPSYSEFKNEFEETIDYDLCKIILENESNLICEESLNEFKKLVDCIDKKTNKLRVHYSPRFGIGRRYPDEPEEKLPNGRPNPYYGVYHAGLIVLARVIKNTIFKFGRWIDLDQVKGHVSILLDLSELNGKELKAFPYYINNFNAIVKMLSEHYSYDEDNLITKKDIKDLFNKTIYGGGVEKWVEKIEKGNAKKNQMSRKIKNKDNHHQVYLNFYREAQELIQLVYDNNQSIQDLVCVNDTDVWSRKNKVMSYFCGIIENDITYAGYKFCYTNGYAPRGEISWGYDGFTSPPSLKELCDTVVCDMNADIQNKLGFKKVRFIIKEIDETEVLQECINKRLLLKEEELTKNQETEETEDKYLIWKKEFEKEWCKILNTSIFIRKYYENGVFKRFVFKSEHELIVSYKHECYTVIIKGKPIKKKYILEWLEDSEMRVYDSAEIKPPPSICPDNIYNLWIPFVYENSSIDEEDYDMNAINLYINHINILCNNSIIMSEYLLNWTAHMYQRPDKKTGVVINLISEEGAGKSSYTESNKRMMGETKVLETAVPERDVWGSFNMPMLNATLVVLSETDKRNINLGNTNGEGQLKKLVTDYEKGGLIINSKGKDQISIASMHNFIRDTNSLDPFTTSNDDRRNVAIRCSMEKKGDTEYFRKLYEMFDSVNGLRSIYWWLKRRDLSNWDMHVIPRTDYHNILISGNQNTYVEFMKYFTVRNHTRQNVIISGVEMLDLFTKWNIKYRYKTIGDRINAGTLLKCIITQVGINDDIAKPIKTALCTKREYNIELLKKKFNFSNEDCENAYTDLCNETPLFLSFT